MSILNGTKDVKTSPIDEIVEDREPLTTESAVLKKEEEKRKAKGKELYNKRASIWAEQKKMVENFTEEELDDFLKKNEHRKNEKRNGTFTMSVNIYQHVLVKKGKYIKGTAFWPWFFELVKKDLDRSKKMMNKLKENK